MLPKSFLVPLARAVWYVGPQYSQGPLELSPIPTPIHLTIYSFPVAQMVEHGASNAKIMGSIPRESKS